MSVRLLPVRIVANQFMKRQAAKEATLMTYIVGMSSSGRRSVI